LRVGILSTWGSRCGIAEYTKQLTETFLKLGHDVSIFANYGDTTQDAHDLILNHGRELNVISKTFGVCWWGEPLAMNVPLILSNIVALGIDVLHIQYQASLYKYPELNLLIEQCPVPVVVTMHDSSVHPAFSPLNKNVIIHKRSVYKLGHYIPFPIPEVNPAIVSMGMGRTDVELLSKLCEELGISYTHHDGKTNWLNFDELVSYIKMFDAVVLWYDEPELEGNSAAARLALACHRPLIVNDVKWFSELGQYPTVTRVQTVKQLSTALCEILNLEGAKKHSITECAKQHIQYYKEIGVTCHSHKRK
jgi:hypothetical protein